MAVPALLLRCSRIEHPIDAPTAVVGDEQTAIGAGKHVNRSPPLRAIFAEPTRDEIHSGHRPARLVNGDTDDLVPDGP